MKPQLQISAVLVLIVALWGCHTAANFLFCNHSTESRATSPDGKYVGEVVWEDCGATEHATIVRIRRTRRLFANKENLFTVESSHKINLSWSGNHTLNVDCSDCESRDIGQANRKWLDVTVEYKLAMTGIHGA